MKNHKPISPKSTRQKGVAAIEMAIVLPLLVLIVAGMVEYGRLMWTYDALAKATRDAARYLSTVTVDSTEIGKAKDMVKDAVDAARVDTTNLTTNVTCKIDLTDEGDFNLANCATVSTDGGMVDVAVRYTFHIGEWMPIVGRIPSKWTYTLKPHTTMPYLKFE